MTLKLDYATYEAVKYACLNYHYSKTIPCGKLVKIGVWEEGKFIGVVLYGRGANKWLGSPYGCKQQECCELVRVALTKHKNPVSRIVAISLKLLKKVCPDLKIVVSYADTEQGHHGGIYQAGNWVFVGKGCPSQMYKYKGKILPGRTAISKFGSVIGVPGLESIKSSDKLKYIMPLCQSIRADILKLKKPYLKRDTKANSGNPPECGGAVPTITLQQP